MTTAHLEPRTGKVRTSFRDDVLDRIRQAGIQGISRDDVMKHFKRYPRAKVTVALNELLDRREAYLRNGIYRSADPELYE
jgi:hypothetical protein